MTSEFLVQYANERTAAFHRQAWADSLRSSRRNRLAAQLHRFADRLGARSQGATAHPVGRRAY